MRSFGGQEDANHTGQARAISGAAMPRKLPVAWLCLSSLLIASINLPTLSRPFDFEDDGALVHSQGVASFMNFHERVWSATAAEFATKGPYRPVAWYFWIGQQELFGEDSLEWRCSRFLWTWIAATAFMWLLWEMGFGIGVAVLTTTVAMWNPYRAEVWMSLTHCEGIAMPFAMAGLVCAYRAARSEQAWRWDLAAMAWALLAVGCKNVFAVVIPAQMFLRVCHPDLSLREGVKQFGWRAALLGSVMIFPIVHFVCYRLTMHENRYDMAWEIRQPLRLLNSFLGGIGKDFLGPALVGALALAVWARLRGGAPAPTINERVRFRAAFGAGLILFILGWGVYSPMSGVAGRYTFPGIWGLDILCALLWAKLWALRSAWQKLTVGLLACGLVISAVSHLGKQEKNTSRITAFWDALYCVEQEAPPGSRIGWVAVHDRMKTEELEIGEGVHFHWHLQGRGRRDLYWQTYAPGEPRAAAADEPAILITSSAVPPSASNASWTLLKECRRPYWFGRKEVVCCIWQRGDTAATRGTNGVASSSDQRRR
jgi:hypothetical protein